MSFFSYASKEGTELIQAYLKDSTWGEYLYYLLVGILTVLMYFIINWTFVIVLSILASPFNEIVSSRVEKITKGEELTGLGQVFDGFFKGLFFTIINESKKLGLIFVLTFISLILSYIPLLTPISIFITAILLGVSYLDFNWSRHELPFKDCKKDLFKNIFSYGFGGGFFLILVSIPLINIIVPSWATCYFSLLWVKRNEDRN